MYLNTSEYIYMLLSQHHPTSHVCIMANYSTLALILSEVDLAGSKHKAGCL